MSAMKTYNDLEKKDQYKLDGVIDAVRSVEPSSPAVHNEYGLCATCEHFQIVESEFSVLIARCEEFNINLSTQNKVKYCSLFSERGTMSLWDMKEIAILIDKPKEAIGFVGSGDDRK